MGFWREMEACLTIHAYDELARTVTDAGFYTNGFETYGTWHRTTVCSKRLLDGTLTGNSFWVSRRASGWYVGAWGGFVYYLPDESRLAEMCIAWLTRVPNGTRPDFDKQLKKEFGLIAADEAFEKEKNDSQGRGQTRN